VWTLVVSYPQVRSNQSRPHQDGDAVALVEQVEAERLDQGRFADTRRTGQADPDGPVSANQLARVGAGRSATMN